MQGCQSGDRDAACPAPAQASTGSAPHNCRQATGSSDVPVNSTGRSSLTFPRIIFSGLFQSDVSTVNNDPAHFDTARFQPNNDVLAPPQDPQSNGWWNPRGTGSWRFKDCVVTQVLSSPLEPAYLKVAPKSHGAVVALVPQVDLEAPDLTNLRSTSTAPMGISISTITSRQLEPQQCGLRVCGADGATTGTRTLGP